MTNVLIDGQPGDCLPVDDRGLAYADGLFETIAIRQGRPRLLEYHLQRLATGCERLGFGPAPASLPAEVTALGAGHERAVVKLILTRGAGPRGYRPPPRARLTRILQVHPLQPRSASHWHDGVQLIYCRTPCAQSPATAGLKTLGRLEQVLASAEWKDPEIGEGLMGNADGWIGGTFSNLFLVRGDELLTPRLDRGGVAGVMRRLVLEQAAGLGWPCRELRVRTADLESADELFLSNSQFGIWPVRALPGRSLRPGPRTRTLMRALAAQGIEECAA